MAVNFYAFLFCIALTVTSIQEVNGFLISRGAHLRSPVQVAYKRVTHRLSRGSKLFMGRHAVVRALTKARTDGAKSKNNSRL